MGHFFENREGKEEEEEEERDEINYISTIYQSVHALPPSDSQQKLSKSKLLFGRVEKQKKILKGKMNRFKREKEGEKEGEKEEEKEGERRRKRRRKRRERRRRRRRKRRRRKRRKRRKERKKIIYSIWSWEKSSSKFEKRNAKDFFFKI